jgi:hypothetical protein
MTGTPFGLIELLLVFGGVLVHRRIHFVHAPTP